MPPERRVGTSGWSYRHWRGTFYPPSLAAGRWLEAPRNALALRRMVAGEDRA